MSFEVDEELWFGERADAESEKLAAQSMAARAGRILGAKPFPLAARKLAELTRDPEVPLADLVAVLESDSALSARLLRLVNSAGYALRVRCTSVRHAAALVGIEKLHQVSTTAAILDLFDSQTTHAARILEHGTIVAALSRYLAAHLSLPTDELFTAGFLHDIGKLMLLETEGERYVELLEQNANSFDSLHRAERERFGFDHAVLGAHVLAAWNIPQPIPRLVAWHHQLGRAYEAGTRWCSMICTLRLADQLSYCLDADDAGETISRVAAGEAAKFLDISEAQLDAMWHELRILILRSRAVFRGEEPPVLEPLPAHRFGRLKKSVEEAPSTQEPRVPKSFPCVVCEEPSFGNRCQACGGHVCPEHELAPDSWCTLCVQDWHEHLEQSQLSLPRRLLITSVGIVLAAVAGYGASRGEVTSGVSVAVGSTLALALAWTVALVAGRWWRRTGFLRHRPNREQHEARRVAPEAEGDIAGDSPELQAAVAAALPDLGTEGPDSGPPDSDLNDPGETTPADEVESRVSPSSPSISWAPADDEEEARASIPGPSISRAPEAEARVSIPSPKISFAPVSNEGAWGDTEDCVSSPSELPEPPNADAAGAHPPSQVSLSNPLLRDVEPAPPSKLPEEPACVTSSLTLGQPQRLSVSASEVQQRADCSAALLGDMCFREVLLACHAGLPTCSGLTEERWATLGNADVREGDQESSATIGPTELRHAC